MLARHLLFLATCRPHNGVVSSIPPETAASQITQQLPPPYIAPPQPQNWQRYQQHDAQYSNKQNQENIGPNSHEKLQSRLVSDPRNFVRQQPFSPSYYTMPNRKSHNDIKEQIRCVTPDITRGLDRQIDDKNLARNGLHISAVDSRNKFLAPLGLSALGYRFFASSPVNSSSPNNRNMVDGSSHPSISPISSKRPGPRSSATVAQRLSISPRPWAISASTGSLDCKENRPITPVETIGRNLSPMNLLLSPIKSTMSNEELFAAIHKSKRKLNIKNETDRLASGNSMDKFYEQIGTRHSWSPESKNTPEVPPAILMPSATARMDFKRLLLQQSTKSNPNRVSATEQLKLSRQQHHYQQQHQQQHQQYQQYQPRNQQQSPQQPSLARALSPRSVWRFQTPRSDVLSSTIVEDTAAEERAMKLSPENQTQNNKLPARRQLVLSGISPISKQESTMGYNRNISSEHFEMNNRLSRVNNVDLNSDNESRRLRNEKARADFLATGIAPILQHGFRARSESPRNPTSSAKSVTRSPRAPTLETAL